MAKQRADNMEWEKFAAGVKNKRIKRNSVGKETGKPDVGCIILKNQEMIVQLLESEKSGKAKKYERAGPQEFVEFCYDEATIENMKVACNKHFKDRLLPGMSCDILAGERGPLCPKTSHMPNFKVIHVRFVKGDGISSSSSSCISSEVLERPAF